MKRSLIVLVSAVVALAFGACDKHSWEDTKATEDMPAQKGTKHLFKKHGDGHGGGGGGGGHDDHGKDAHKKGSEDTDHHPEKEADGEDPKTVE